MMIIRFGCGHDQEFPFDLERESISGMDVSVCEDCKHYCGCYWAFGLYHATEQECQEFRFCEEVMETLAVGKCYCCKRLFLYTDMEIDGGDPSVGLGELDLCKMCASEECLGNASADYVDTPCVLFLGVH